MHPEPMYRSIALIFVVLLSGCATRPQQPIEPVSAPAAQVRTGLNGLTSDELVGHFGRPALQIREGTSLKLQFRGRSCVLDAYLYPQAGGMLRVTHVDTRSPNGADIDQAACIFALENPS